MANKNIYGARKDRQKLKLIERNHPCHVWPDVIKRQQAKTDTLAIHFMRHGKAESVEPYELTELGKEQVLSSARIFAQEFPDAKDVLIISSDITRAAQSANILAEVLGVDEVYQKSGFRDDARFPHVEMERLISHANFNNKTDVIVVTHEPIIEMLQAHFDRTISQTIGNASIHSYLVDNFEVENRKRTATPIGVITPS